jgi:hypothetical protein
MTTHKDDHDDNKKPTSTPNAPKPKTVPAVDPMSQPTGPSPAPNPESAPGGDKVG